MRMHRLRTLWAIAAVVLVVLVALVTASPAPSPSELEVGSSSTFPRVSNKNHHRPSQEDEDEDSDLGCSPDAVDDECGDDMSDAASMAIRKLVQQRRSNLAAGKNPNTGKKGQNIILANDNKIHNSERHFRGKKPKKPLKAPTNLVKFDPSLPSDDPAEDAAEESGEEEEDSVAPVEKQVTKEAPFQINIADRPEPVKVEIPKGIPSRKPRSKIFIDTAQSTLFCINGKPERSRLLHPHAIHTPAWCPYDDGYCCAKSLHCCGPNLFCHQEKCLTRAQLDALYAKREQTAKEQATKLEEQLMKRRKKLEEQERKETAVKAAAEARAKAAEAKAKKAEYHQKEAQNKATEAEQKVKSHLKRAQELRAKEALKKKEAIAEQAAKESKKREEQVKAEQTRKKVAEEQEKRAAEMKTKEMQAKSAEEMKQKKIAAENAEQEAKKAENEEQAKKDAQEMKTKKYFKPRKGRKFEEVAKLPKGNGKYTFMFWIRPLKILPQWGQLLHKGEHRRDRGIAVWVIPKTSRLHVRSGTSMGWNTGVNTRALDMNRWAHVAVTHQDHALNVYFDGELVRSRRIPPPTENGGDLWTCAPWYEAADVYMADIQYHNRILSLEEIKETVGKEAWK